MKKIVPQLKRISLDLALLLFLMFVLWIGFDSYTISNEGIVSSKIPPIISTVLYKALLVSIAVVHGHVTRKLLLPGAIDWTDKSFTPKKVLSIIIYAMFIFAYSRGG